uniref:Uncharacterized protein n=1 Tax=Physcomitrium patens TaxID=3218 RepID=A0A2K1IJK3_PHYPA|nr:hypothetical protein PHYPA_028150 [Physcomitrium patens]
MGGGYPYGGYSEDETRCFEEVRLRT